MTLTALTTLTTLPLSLTLPALLASLARVSSSQWQECPAQCQCEDAGSVSVTCLNVVMEGLPNTLNPQLEKLVISRTNISHLESFFFTSFPMLTLADLSSNKVARLQENVWKESNKLERLSLANNKIKLMPDFTGLQSLTRLDLSHNHIQTLPRDIVHTRLEQLDLSSNEVIRLTDLPTSLEVLNLSRNKISSVSEVLSDLPRLLHLDLSHNPLLTLRPPDLSQVPNLLGLNLASTGLSEVPSLSLVEVEGLLQLDLSHNNLSVLRSLALEGLGQLESLAVSHCPLLSRVEARVFGEQNLNMTSIDLSNNPRLSSLQADCLTGVMRLEQLLIQGNNLSSMEVTPVMSSVRAEDNPWLCDCRVLNLQKSLATLEQTVLCHLPSSLQGLPVVDVDLRHCLEDREILSDEVTGGGNYLYFYCIVVAGCISILVLILIFCRKNLVRAFTKLR